ncbi:hypothetical protein SVIOM74S_05052 [Streptomyces violarus]
MTAPTKPPHTSPSDPAPGPPSGESLHSPVIDWFDETPATCRGGAPKPGRGV